MRGALLVLAACGSSPSRTVEIDVLVGGGHDLIAARVAIADAKGEPVHFGKLDLYNQRQGAGACVIAPGVYLTWSGLVLAGGTGTIPVGTGACEIPPGTYTFTAWHGIDHAPASRTITLPIDHRVSLVLAPAFSSHGALAADLHVHGSSSDDSNMPDEERVAAQAAAGIDVIGFSNHNTNADLHAAIAALHLQARIVSIASTELTSESLHIGVYPVPIVAGAPRGGGPDPKSIVSAGAKELFAIARAMPTHPIVQVNHPRFRYGALFDLTKWDGVAWPPPFPLDFDAVETIGGFTANNTPGDARLDDSVRDLYTLTDHGKLVAAMGNSDTHDFTWVFDGTARTYVFPPHPSARNEFDPAVFVDAIRARHTLATTCPWIETTPLPGAHVRASGGHVHLALTLQQAPFCHATTIDITVGGKLIESVPIVTGTYARTILDKDLDVGSTADTWIGVVAHGTEPLPLAQTGTYQRDKWKKPGVTPYAVISPIIVDVDGDGRWKRGDADLLLDTLGE